MDNNLPVSFTSHFVLDVESDGPCPGLYNMISFGLSSVYKPELTFYRMVLPITNDGIPQARNVSGISYDEQIMQGSPVRAAMDCSATWLKQTQLELCGQDKRVTIWSDNPAYDWQFWNYYFAFSGLENPAGFSARRIGDLWAGHKERPLETAGWKRFRKTKHTHNPADDARGNAEALQVILQQILSKKDK